MAERGEIMTATIMTDEQDFVFSRADVAHLEEAISLLRGRRQHTAAERVGVVRNLIATCLEDAEDRAVIHAELGVGE